MAYTIQTADSVEAYLRSIEALSEAGKQQVIEGYLGDLGEEGIRRG